jgi:hypothetical protein
MKAGQKLQSFKKPRFMQNGITGADRGNATHAFLQFCDFSKITDPLSFEKEKQRLLDYDFITNQQSGLVDGDGILEFITSDLMQSLIALDSCKKEDRFIFTIPAREVTDIDSDEPVVIQGIIDCWFEKNGAAVIVDYKTDRVTDESELVSRYKVQLDMYEKALLSILYTPDGSLSPQAKLFIVEYKDKIIGSSLCLYEDGRANLAYSCGLRKSHPLLYPGIMAIWAAITDADRQGYEHFEFLEVRGLSRLRKSFLGTIGNFGGKDVSTLRWYHFKLGWLNKFLRWIYV